jgi:hypothetical protein
MTVPNKSGVDPALRVPGSPGLTTELLLDHLYLLIGLFGIPSAVLGGILFDVQLSRLAYGQANPFLLFLEVGSLLAIPVLILWLRFQLARPSAPTGFYRHILDFLALKHWHPAVTFSLVGLFILPVAWLAHHNHWLFIMFRNLGERALLMTDVQATLDAFAVGFQVTLLGGLPSLLLLHVLSRWKPNRYLPWLLVPMLFIVTVIAAIMIVTVAHFSQ